MNQKRMQQLRKRLGWKQDEMANAIGASSKLIVSQFETGFRNPNAIISRFLEYLESLSDAELKKAAAILQRLAARKHHEP